MYKNNSTDIIKIVILIVFIIVSPLCYIAGYYDSKKTIQQQAIDNNVAGWTVDAKTGETKFTWRHNDGN